MNAITGIRAKQHAYLPVLRFWSLLII